MSKATNPAFKIASNLKGLRNYLQPNEQVLMTVPGIWDNGQQNQSTACDIILTNQRLLGYYLVSFPRERLFLDALQLSAIRAIALRQKSFEPIFRELMVSTDDRRVYIRSPRQKIEALNTALRIATGQHSSEPATSTTSEPNTTDQPVSPPPTFGRQEISKPFEGSPLSISILFAGGLFLEILGGLIWLEMHSAQIGAPLLLAGLVSWLAALFLRKKKLEE